MANHNFLHATLGFVTCSLLVLAYLFSFYGGQLPLVFFWIPMISAIALATWQCTAVGTDRRRTLIVLLEVLALGFLAHMVFVIPSRAGVIGRDVFADLTATEYDRQYGWPIPTSVPITGITRTVSDWPLLHFLALAASDLLGIELFSVSDPNNIMRWFPSVISMGTPLFWYTITKRTYGREDVSLLAALGSSMVFYNMMFHSWYVRETLGYVLLFGFILSFVISSARATQSLGMKLIAVVFLVGLLFSHHLSFVFALLLLALAILLPRLVDRFWIRTSARRTIESRGKRMPAGMQLILGLTMFVAYLIYIGEPVFVLLLNSIQALFEPRVAVIVRSSGTVLSRDRILLTARVILGLIFAVVLIRQILRKDRTMTWDVIGFAWGVVTAVAVTVSYVIANVVNAGILRLEGFGWPFVIMPASNLVARKPRGTSGTVLIAAFIVLNIFVIPPYIYDSSATPDYPVGETSIRYTHALYAAASWFRGEGTIIGDVSTFELFGDFGQKPVVTDFGIFGGNLTGISKYQWLVLRKENANVVVSLSGSQIIGKVSDLTWSMIDSTHELSKIYDNGDVEIFKVDPT